MRKPKFLSFGKLFGENISWDSERLSQGDTVGATSWLERLHPLMRRPAKTDVVRGETFRALPFYFLLLLSFFTLGIRLTYLALFRGEEYLLAAEGNRIVAETIQPERGVITDRNGKVIAGNVPGFRVVAEPRICLSRCDLDFLARLLDVGETEVTTTLEEGGEVGLVSVVLKGSISRDTAVRLEANMERLPGISVEAIPLRSYPYPYEFAHVLGYTGEISAEELEQHSLLGYELGDWVGKAGLEGFYEERLQGRRGRRVLEKDAAGRVVRELAKQLPERGETLITTLDLPLQRYAYQVLKRWMGEAKSSAGALVVADVNTGEILSLVSCPSFDPGKVDRFLADKNRPLFNRAIAGTYPPGSTFKLVTGSAALEEGIISASTVIYDRGAISIGSYVFRGWNPSGLGPLSFVDAIAWSSDIYFYTVAGGYGSQPGVGPEKLAGWARKYGLGEPAGIDLPGEARGIVPDPQWKHEVRGESWFIGNTYHMGIGQGDVALTPLQLNMVTAIVANGGRRVKPHLVTDRLMLNESEGDSSFVSQKTLSLIRQGMRKALTDGPNRFGNSNVVAIAGKTGTAETPSGNPHSWFTAFAPYEKPQIAVTVIIENGARLGAYHPSVKAAREVMEYWFGRR